MAQHRYLAAEPLRLDREDERIWCDGEVLRLGGKAFALLRALMERPRKLVTKDALLDIAWPNVTVSESVLTTAVKELRQALGDSARQPRFIETVHGRGYRFLLDVDETDDMLVGTAPTTRPALSRAIGIRIGLLMAALLVVATTAVGLFWAQPGKSPTHAASDPNAQSIAVLPFQDLSADRDQAWFAEGIREEILNSLTRTPDLRVAARTSTASVTSGDIREIGRRFNVAHVLEGSVRRDGGRVRVTTQLIRTSDGFHLWSQNYDRSPGDIITIQEDIAIAIAGALKSVMSPERLKSMVQLGTRSVEAYEQYLKGLALQKRQLETGDVQYATLSSDAYERARSLDPQFAAAHWAAAQYWFGRTTRVGAGESLSKASEKERLREYLTRIDAAIASSPDRPENLKYRSARALTRLQLREALQLMLEYLRGHPRDLDAWEDLVDLAGYMEDRPLMARAGERIHTLSLESGSPRSRAITASVLSMDFENAIARARQQLALSPNEVLIQYQAHRALIWGGQKDQARTILRRILASSLPAENKLLAQLRQACADGGAGATEIGRRIETQPGITLSSRWNAADLLGEPDRAAQLLRPLDNPEQLPTLIQYLVYPSFDARPFPNLQAELRANGIRRPEPRPIPFGC